MYSVPLVIALSGVFGAHLDHLIRPTFAVLNFPPILLLFTHTRTSSLPPSLITVTQGARKGPAAFTRLPLPARRSAVPPLSTSLPPLRRASLRNPATPRLETQHTQHYYHETCTFPEVMVSDKEDGEGKEG